MKLEHFGMAEPGDCRLVFTASAEELAAALAKELAAPDAQHVAIIMDGNGRWAKQRGHERSYGHQAGAEIENIYFLIH